MSQLPTVPSSGCSTGWRLVGPLFVLLLGVIGMYGIGPHGVGPHGVDPHGASTAGSVALAPVLAHAVVVGERGDHPLSTGSQAMTTFGGLVKASVGGDAHGPSLLEVCMAVLLGFTLILLIALAGGRRPALGLHVLRLGPTGPAERADQIHPRSRKCRS